MATTVILQGRRQCWRRNRLRRYIPQAETDLQRVSKRVGRDGCLRNRGSCQRVDQLAYRTRGRAEVAQLFLQGDPRRLLGRAPRHPDDARHDLFRRAHRAVAEHSDLVDVVDQQSRGLLVG